LHETPRKPTPVHAFARSVNWKICAWRLVGDAAWSEGRESGTPIAKVTAAQSVYSLSDQTIRLRY